MDEIKVLYECDPEKNTECRKIMCFTKAGGRGSKCVCTATKNPEYAKKDQDGQPIISKEWMTWQRYKEAKYNHE